MNIKKPLTISIKLIFIFLLLILNTGCFMYSTNSTEIGVRTRKISFFGKKGVEQKFYQPASTYFFFPIINDWNTFDTKLQNIEMTFDQNRGDIVGRDDLLFKTHDGNDISLDIIISYRILPEKAAHILQYVAKNDFELRGRIVRILARSIPRDVFGELSTEDFYNASIRAKKAESAKNRMNKILDEYGVIIERVLTKDYRFNTAYQQAIEDKKVADQQTEKNKSENNAKKEEYLRKIEDTQGEVNTLIAESDGEYLKAKIDVDAYYDQQKKIAQAIIEEGKAEAKGIKKMNQALRGSGGKTMVKLKMAEKLLNKKIILLPSGGNSGLSLKTMDMNQILNTYGIRSMAKPNPKNPAPQKNSE